MRARWLLALAPLALAACNGQGGADAEGTEVPKEAAGKAVSGQVVESEYGTPVKDRVATRSFTGVPYSLSTT
ncbi:MAG: hypothetical protein ACKOPE_05210 [Novosphingobium sp.]